MNHSSTCHNSNWGGYCNCSVKLHRKRDKQMMVENKRLKKIIEQTKPLVEALEKALQCRHDSFCGCRNECHDALAQYRKNVLRGKEKI